MKHFWLHSEQQARMDAATSTAEDYGYIGLLNLSTNWKMAVKRMVGSVVDDADQIRIFSMTHDCSIRRNSQIIKLKSAVRLNKEQALLLKLRVAGSGTEFLCADPTGESWGNINIALAAREPFGTFHQRDFRPRTATLCLARLIDGHSFGPTLSDVGDTCLGMPIDWAQAFVWQYVDETRHFPNKISDIHRESVEAEIAEYMPQSPIQPTPHELHARPLVTIGDWKARRFAALVQCPQRSKWYGVTGPAGPILT